MLYANIAEALLPNVNPDNVWFDKSYVLLNVACKILFISVSDIPEIILSNCALLLLAII